MDYVFVLDISGSMMDDSKLQLSRDSIDAFIRELGTDDRFELITFNVAPQPLFKELRAVNKESQTQGRGVPASSAGTRRHGLATGDGGRLPLRKSRPPSERRHLERRT